MDEMTKKNITLKDCDKKRAEMLYREIGKVRCWISGWQAAHNKPGGINIATHIPGEAALRQIQIILKDSIR